jgi:hypothetical protein
MSSKAEMIRQIVKASKDAQDGVGDMFQEISGFLDSQGMMSESEIIRMTLESLNKKKLLVPLMVAAFQKDIIDWSTIDSLTGAYEDDIGPMLLNSLKKTDVEKAHQFFVGD